MQPCGVWTVSDIPDEQLAFAVAMAKLDNPSKIETQQEPDGQWTIVSTFPPCEGDTGERNVTFAGVRSSVSITKLPGKS